MLLLIIYVFIISGFNYTSVQKTEPHGVIYIFATKVAFICSKIQIKQ